MEHFAPVKNNKLNVYISTWMEFKGLTLTEKLETDLILEHNTVYIKGKFILENKFFTIPKQKCID